MKRLGKKNWVKRSAKHIAASRLKRKITVKKISINTRINAVQTLLIKIIKYRGVSMKTEQVLIY